MNTSGVKSPISIAWYAAIMALTVTLFFGALYLIIDKFRDDMQFLQHEFDVLPELDLTLSYITKIQRLRGLREMRIGGSQVDKTAYQALYDSLVNDIAVHVESPTTEPFVKTTLTSIMHSLSVLHREQDDLEQPTRQFDEYSLLISRVADLRQKLAENSNITLDAHLDSYYLSKLLVIHIPRLMEHEGRIRGLLSYAGIKESHLTLVANDLRYELRSHQVEAQELNRMLTLLSRKGIGLATHLKRWRESSHTLLTITEQTLDGISETIMPVTLFELGSQSIESLIELYRHANDRLAGLIVKRKEQLRFTLMLILIGAGIGLLLTVLISIYLYRRSRTAFAALQLSNNHNRDIKERQRAVLENMNEGVVTFNEGGIIQSINPAIARLFGYTEHVLLGSPITVLIPELYSTIPDRVHADDLINHEQNMIGVVRELTGVHMSGKAFAMELYVTELQVTGERLFSAIVHDITERKRIIRMKDEFVSTVSHELRTPLTAIRGALGLVSGGAMGEVTEQIKPMMDIATENTERLLYLINDLLDIQKIESGNMVFHFTDIEMGELLNRSIHECQTYGKQYEVTFEFDGLAEPVFVSADRQRLMQVMANLLSNAAKFSHRGGGVKIMLRFLDDERVRISVIDNGSGIPEAFQSRVFEKFSQNDASDTKPRGGTGLGLSITKVIVEQHNGQISFETVPGEGTTFHVDLPVSHQRHEG